MEPMDVPAESEEVRREDAGNAVAVRGELLEDCVGISSAQRAGFSNALSLCS